jgi:two-component system sensor histidine kinase MprB
MSLRIRLALMCALLSAIAAAAVASVAYFSTSSRMTAEVTRSITQTASYLVTHEGNDFTLETSPFDGEDHRSPNGSLRPSAEGLLNQVAVQLLNGSGQVLPLHRGPRLPLTALDHLIAISGLGVSLHSVTVGTMNFEVITVGVPGGGAIQVAQSLAQRDSVLRDLSLQFGLLALLVTALGATVGWFLAVRLTRPLEALTVATDAFSKSGTLLDLEATERHDEVGRLSRSFSHMLLTLQAAQAAQHQLIRDCGHELRTPLTSLRTNIELLERHGGQLSDQQRVELLDNLHSEFEELSALVEEVLEVATATSADEPFETLDLAEIAGTIAERTERRFGRTVTLNASPTPLEGQRRSLERLLSNLIENAIKFAGESALITVTVAPGLLQVTDSGPGVSKQDLPHLFQRFYRAEASKSISGSGLGLSIVEKIAESHGATPFARNEPSGGFSIGMRWTEA